MFVLLDLVKFFDSMEANKVSEHLPIRITTDQKDAIDKAAKLAGLSRSQFVRRAIQAAVEAQGLDWTELVGRGKYERKPASVSKNDK